MTALAISSVTGWRLVAPAIQREVDCSVIESC